MCGARCQTRPGTTSCTTSPTGGRTGAVSTPSVATPAARASVRMDMNVWPATGPTQTTGEMTESLMLN